MARGRIYNSILDTIGSTPLVRLSRLAEDAAIDAQLLAKLEFFNPLGSVKDRIGLAMIEALEASGKLKPGSIERAEALVGEIPNSVMPQQFHNQANPEIHAKTTAEEIWADAEGCVDVIVSSVGTGGTLTGCGRTLKPRNTSLRLVAVEPEDSAVLSGGTPGAHMIEGIGAGFVPSTLDRTLIDEVLTIANETAFKTARRTAQLEGLPIGISSGAALSAALEVGARQEMAGKQIVVILPSFAERYLSTPLFEGL